MKVRVSYNLKEHEIELIKYASKILEEDMSRLIADAINYKYHWLDKDMCKEYNEKNFIDISMGKKKQMIPMYTKNPKGELLK